MTEADSEYDKQNRKENIVADGGMWISARHTPYPHYFTLDTGGEQSINGFIYSVMWLSGAVEKYRIRIDGIPVMEGSFGNIRNHPIPQVVTFPAPVRGQIVQFEALTPAKPDSCFASCSLFEIF